MLDCVEVTMPKTCEMYHSVCLDFTCARISSQLPRSEHMRLCGKDAAPESHKVTTDESLKDLGFRVAICEWLYGVGSSLPTPLRKDPAK